MASLRAAGRHFGVSVETIRRAIKRRDLVRCLSTDDRGRQVIDLAIAEQEWPAGGSSPQQVIQRALTEPGSRPKAKRRSAEAVPETPVDSFAVLRDGSRVLLCWHPNFDDDERDPDDGVVFSLSDVSAMVLALALRERATDPRQTFLQERFEQDEQQARTSDSTATSYAAEPLHDKS